MTRSPEEWHQRFIQQAGWTSQARAYLLRKSRLGWRARILEVGCGTGAVTQRLNQETRKRIYGVDFNRTYLRLAAANDPQTRFCTGDGLALPYASGAFDAVVCHYFLLWIDQPAAALAEMTRAARPGGSVIALAEPDYAGRVDAPPELEVLGRLQAEALRHQGAETSRGRQLAALFQNAGLAKVESGVMGGQWQKRNDAQEIRGEWDVLAAELEGMLDAAELRRLEQVNIVAWQAGQRVLFVPTFYAMGIRE
jgi:ubiquinone/menaquinone biosynthesis C-methylase UbiE